MGFHTKLACTLALALSLLSGNVHAILIDNATSMIDSDTGLEWLDLTETLGWSWNQTEASSYVTNDGYVHATVDQVTTLFTNAGFLTTNNVNNPANNQAAADLLAFLGCTQFCGTNFETGRGFADNGGGWTVRPNYHAGPLGAGAAVISLFSNNFDLVDLTAGHFLVREAVTVPEPSLLALLSIGLLGMGVAIKCRKH